MARPRFGPRKPGQPSIGRRRRTLAAPKISAKMPEGMTTTDELAELIGSLTGKEVTVGACAAIEPGPASPVVVSAYVDDAGKVGALIVADIAASAGIAAALTLMPAGAVTEASRAGALDEVLLENWNEIANICTQVVRLPAMPKYKLLDTTQSSSGLTSEVEALLQSAPYRVGWSVGVPGFANGKLAVYLAGNDL